METSGVESYRKVSLSSYSTSMRYLSRNLLLVLGFGLRITALVLSKEDSRLVNYTTQLKRAKLIFLRSLILWEVQLLYFRYSPIGRVVIIRKDGNY